MTIKPGDTVQFDTHSNLGLCTDKVREVFTQHDTLGHSGPALVLTNYSWCWLEDVTRKISTSYQYPPIPIRDFDWSAVDDNTYDGPGSPCGWGATEDEAIKDLLRQLEEEDE